MGGKALSSITPRRVDAKDYRDLCERVVAPLRKYYARVEDVPAYRQKPDFGDVDILVDFDGPVDQLAETGRRLFQPREMVVNGNCVSLDHEGVQVDLIAATNYEMAMLHYAYNDLGNMIGTVAHGFGLKVDLTGLYLPLRINGKSTELARPLVTEMPKQVLGFLGYDPDRYDQGFDTVKDIFDFATSTPYFDPKLFSAERVNHQSRTRQKKRTIISQFMEHLATTPGLRRYEFNDDPMSYFGKIAEAFPAAKLRERREQLVGDYDRRLRVRDRLNSFLPEIPLSGPALGAALDGLRKSVPNFQDFMEKGTDDQIREKLRGLR
jgi:hypothetical protein